MKFYRHSVFQRFSTSAFQLLLLALTPISLHAGGRSASLSEDAALNLLLNTVQKDHVYDRRISLDCVSFETEEKTAGYFEFALREKHDAKCGGDPDVSPVVDRYRVHRDSRKIERYDVVSDSWRTL